MLTYLYSIYQSSFKLFKIRYIIRNINSYVIIINVRFKAFGCLRLILVPRYGIFFAVFYGRSQITSNETCAMSAYKILIQLREL